MYCAILFFFYTGGSCEDRYRYVLGTQQNDKERVEPEDALAFVNDVCKGQCFCSDRVIDKKCSANCTDQDGKSYSCHTRFKYHKATGLSSDGSRLAVDDALEYINDKCNGQCSCELDEIDSSCHSECVSRDGRYDTCINRYQWVIGSQQHADGSRYTPQEALDIINQDCDGQCSCSLDDLHDTCDSFCLDKDLHNNTCDLRTRWIVAHSETDSGERWVHHSNIDLNAMTCERDCFCICLPEETARVCANCGIANYMTFFVFVRSLIVRDFPILLQMGSRIL